MSNSSRNSACPVTAQLVGGIGNQLFIYSAARQLAEINSSPLILDESQIGVGGTNHGSLLSETNLKGEFKVIKKRSPKFVLRIQNYLKRLITSKLEGNFFSRNTYNSQILGYDPNVLNLVPPVTLIGYFQSWRYAENILPKIRSEIELKDLSSWFTEIRERIKVEKPIVVHVRRGDYMSLADDFGILGARYYERALRLVDEHFSDKKVPIWVFSDDVQKAKKLLLDLGNYEITFIDPPANASALESMLLMSYGSAHIIANSTFSWWSAHMSQTTEIVVAPSKWFRNREDPADLLPPEWRLADSHWDVG
jgi:hypothetical protein